MGFRQAAVLSSACFFLGPQVPVFSKALRYFTNPVFTLTGVLFICFNVDYRVLFLPVTDETVADAFQFYTMFYNAPPAIKVRILFSYEVRDQRGLTLGNGPGLFPRR